MIKSKLLNFIVVLIGSIFLILAIEYSRARHGFAIVHFLLALWCITGAVRNLIATRSGNPIAVIPVANYRAVKTNIIVIVITFPLLVVWLFFLEPYSHLWFVHIPGIIIGLTFGVSCFAAFIVALVHKAKDYQQ